MAHRGAALQTRRVIHVTSHFSIHVARGAWGEAQRWFERALEEEPLDEEALQGLAEVRMRAGETP